MDNANILNKIYNFNDEAKVWLKKDAPAFFYSDGDQVEKAIGDALKSVKDRSVFSDELKLLQNGWAATYYFSANRANLLRPLAKRLLHGARVLELGCGMGALTRYLGESCKEVVAVEGSARRASVAALRCEDLPNVTILVDDIRQLPAELGQFDVVTLIGVLEYSRRYGGAGSEEEILKLVRSFLTPTGSLILALENKLGLKYFAGVPEDHIPRPFLGLTNGYSPNGVQTWSRKELAQMLRNAGFNNQDQFISLPDYKLPTSIISPEGLKASGGKFNLFDIMTAIQRPYEKLPLFNMAEAWESVIKAGLLPDLADSLCFVASGADRPSPFEPGELAVIYSSTGNILRKYAKEIKILEENGKIRVQKRKLFPEEATSNYKQVVEDEPYYEGRLLLSEIRKITMRPDWTLEELFNALQPWYKMLYDNMDAEGYCDGELLDLVPFNIIMNNGKAKAFDLEWQTDKKIPITVLLHRGLFNTLMRIMPIRRSSKHNVSTFQELFQKFMATQNVPASFPLSPDYLAWQETKFQEVLRGNKIRMKPIKDFNILYMP